MALGAYASHVQDAGGRVQWADAARGLAIALVVLHHAAKRSVTAGSADWWLGLTDMLATMRMPLFFAVAGVFAATWVSDQRTWPQLLRAKVLLFAWVYALWVVVRYLWFLTVPQADGNSMALSDLALRVVYPSGGWFIFALALMFVLARSVRSVPSPVVLVAASAVSVVFLAGWVRFENSAWDGLGMYTVFFLLGIALRDHLLERVGRVPLWAAALVPVAWVALYLGCAEAGLVTAPVVGLVLRLAGIAAGVGLALLLQRWSGLRALGHHTLPVYLAHQLLVVTAVGWLGSWYAFDEVALLEHGAPVLVAIGLVALTYSFGRLAPRVGLAWLFATPRWLERLAGAPVAVSVPTLATRSRRPTSTSDTTATRSSSSAA